jgi:hypothetical protein
MKIEIRVKNYDDFNDQSAELMKSLGHKYIKRVPKKTGKGYDYYYSDGHGGLVVGNAPKAGAKPKHYGSMGKKQLPATVINGDKVSFNTGNGTVFGMVTGTSPDKITVKGKDGKTYTVARNSVKKVVAKVNKDDEIRNLYDTAHIKGGWRNGEKNGLQPESCDTWEGMTKAAAEGMAAFSKYDEAIAEKFADIGAKLYKRTTLKKQKRAFEKLRDDETDNRKKKIEPYQVVDDRDDKNPIYHCRTLRDVDGHTFCCKNIKDVSKMLAYFNAQTKDIIRIKNNFAKPSPVGYSDINMNIRLPNGTVAEIQLNTTANMVAKENYGHALYEVYRSISSNPKYKNLAEKLSSAQKKLYGMSNELSKNGNFPDMVPFGATYKPYGEAIRMDVRAALGDIQMAYQEKAINDETFEHVQELLKRIG